MTENILESEASLKVFNIDVPNGFITLPIDLGDGETILENIADQTGTTLGIDSNSQGAAAAAASFFEIGNTMGRTGADYASVGFFLSPDFPFRPVMISLCGLATPPGNKSRPRAVNSLLKFFESSNQHSARRITVPAGPVAVVITEEENEIAIGGTKTPILTRHATAWVPDPDGTTMGIISVMGNCYQEWQHVCSLALDIYDSFSREQHETENR